MTYLHSIKHFFIALILYTFSHNSFSTSFHVPPDSGSTTKTLTDGETGIVDLGNTLSVLNNKALTIGGGSTFINNGTTTCTDAISDATIVGALVSSNNPVLINNSGNLRRDGGGNYVINLGSLAGDVTIINSGNLSGDTFAGTQGITTIINSASANWNTPFQVSFKRANITNSGLFTGDIHDVEQLTLTNNATGTFESYLELTNTVETSSVINSGIMIGDITTNFYEPGSIVTFESGSQLQGTLWGTEGINNILNVNGNSLITGFLVDMARVNLNAGLLTVTDYWQCSSGILSFTLTSNNNFGHLRIRGSPVFCDDIQLQIIVPNNNTIANGDMFDIITSDSEDLPDLSNFTVDMSQVASNVTFTLTQPSPLILRLLAMVERRNPLYPLRSAISFPGLSSLAQNLEGIFEYPSCDMIFVSQAFNNLNTAELTQAVQSIAFDINGSVTLASLTNQNNIITDLNNHLDTIRLAGMDSPLMGYIAGDIYENCWGIKPIFFGNTARQKDVETIFGYKADSKGLGLLFDTKWDDCFINDSFFLGLGFTYSSSHVKTPAFQNRTDIKSVQGLIYAAYDYCQFFIDGIFGLAQNKYNTTHNSIIGSVLQRSAFSQHNGYQTSGKIRTGYYLPIFETELSPIASLFQTTLRQNPFVENNAGGLNQSIQKQKDSLLQASFGFIWTYTGCTESFMPDIHAYYLRNMRNPNLQVTSSLLGGGAAFTTTSPTLPRDQYNVGLGTTFFLQENMGLSFRYDLETRKKFKNNVLNLLFSWSF